MISFSANTVCQVWLLFNFLYGFFLRRNRQLTYGIPSIILLSGIFFIDYWFEQLSIVVLFELLLFLNIRRKNKKNERN